MTSVCVGGRGGGGGHKVLLLSLSFCIHPWNTSPLPAIVDPSGSVNSSLLSEVLTLLLRHVTIKMAVCPSAGSFIPSLPQSPSAGGVWCKTSLSAESGAPLCPGSV